MSVSSYPEYVGYLCLCEFLCLEYVGYLSL